MINWKDPTKDLPKDGEYVAAIKYHWKECWPLSAQIMFGEVQSYINEDSKRVARINNCDFTGAGSYCWYFPIYDCGNDSDTICAWAYAKDFKKPEFINHDAHWGKEK